MTTLSLNNSLHYVQKSFYKANPKQTVKSLLMLPNKTIAMQFRKDIFPDNTRPTAGGFFVVFHLPNQFLLSGRWHAHQWKEDNKDSTFIVGIFKESFETLKQRYKRDTPCIQDWENYDRNVIEQHITAIGCRTPFQKSRDGLPICT